MSALGSPPCDSHSTLLGTAFLKTKRERHLPLPSRYSFFVKTSAGEPC
jgi:hypothetical protein